MTQPVHIKTFRSRTLQEAIARIRSELGPDAEVLETKQIRGNFMGFSRSRIEVTASSYLPVKPTELSSGQDPISVDALPKSNSPQSNMQHDQPDRLGVSDVIATAEPNSADCSPSISNRPFEGANTSSVIAPTTDTIESFERPYRRVFDDLVAANINPSIAQQWVVAAKVVCGDNPRDIWSVRVTISRWIRDWVSIAEPIDLHSETQHRIAFLGGSGVGKTTTLAKMAAMLSIEYGARVGILSLDSRPGSGFHLLNCYSKMMGWKLSRIESISEIAAALPQWNDCQFLLIDTPPCLPNSDESISNTLEALNLIQPTSKQLVLSSTTSQSAFDRSVALAAPLGPDQMILTKIDESGGLGGLVESLHRCKLPISFVTTGQEVPNDISQATSLRICQWIMAD
jgi:flagellar biosynthesis protein FlhF